MPPNLPSLPPLTLPPPLPSNHAPPLPPPHTLPPPPPPQLKKAGDKDIDDIKTLMEEVDMRITETKKDTYEFKRDIIIGAENGRTGKIAAEKMIRWVCKKNSINVEQKQMY